MFNPQNEGLTLLLRNVVTTYKLYIFSTDTAALVRLKQY